MWGAVVLALIAMVLPAAAFAQTIDDATSPELHAFFEVEYAREATYLSLTKEHQQNVMTLSRLVKSGTISYQAAAREINTQLTPDEKGAILEVESSFWGALRGFQQAQRISLTAGDVQIDAGRFLLFLFYDMSEAMTK